MEEYCEFEEPVMYPRDGGVDSLIPSDGLHQTIAPVDFSTFQPVSINCTDTPKMEECCELVEPVMYPTEGKVEMLETREGLESKV